LEPFRTDGGTDDLAVQARGIGIHVLVDLDRPVVERVFNAQDALGVAPIAASHPGMGAGPRVAGNEDEMGGADAWYGGEGGVGCPDRVSGRHVIRSIREA